MTELIARRIDFSFLPITAALPLVQAGQLTALAVSTATRSTIIPTVPTTVERGFSNSDYNVWVGVLVSAKTPPEIVQQIYRRIEESLSATNVKARLADLGAETMSMTPALFDEYIRNELAANERILKDK
jgi:tripartite-type tricarboxylate transporter receptor subunit TctC